MSISITEILGTDSLSGSRIVINDNFNIVASEINAMAAYFNSQAGTINNLNDLKTQSLRVGLNTIILDVNSSGIDIFKDVDSSGNISLNSSKLFRNDVNPQTLDDVFVGPSLAYQLGTSTAIPNYTINRVGNANTGSALTLQLNTGRIGQEIFFAYSLATSGNVDIVGAINPLILPGGLTKVRLNGKGDTAKFLCIDNGTGNGDWYLVGGNGYTIV
jgi:hypothetical protein